MKTHISKLGLSKAMMAIMAIATSIVFCNCSDDDESLAQSQIPTEVKTTFSKMFPQAKNPFWIRELQFYVAEFSQNTFENKAWFSPDGSWAMTEIDYDDRVSMLPPAVQTTFENSSYGLMMVDDAKQYTRTADSFCLIEVEKNDGTEISLFYDTFGNLINRIQGDFYQITPYTNIEAISY